jgi:aldehyde:ferredoxin oxidoreductase
MAAEHKLKETEHFHMIVGKQVYDGQTLSTIKNLDQLVRCFPTSKESGMDIISQGKIYGKIFYASDCGDICFIEIRPLEGYRYIIAMV